MNVETQISQVFLKNFYSFMDSSNAVLPPFASVGFSVYSQHDEDGILQYIFSLIGEGNKSFIEIGCGYPNGIENNTSNLAINHGWHGLMIDRDEEWIRKTREILETHKNTLVHPVRIEIANITADNINQTIESFGYKGQIDLFSLDVDSVDYYIIENLSVVTPRVIVVETPPIWGPGYAKTVPNNPEYNCVNNPHFYGASLEAFTKLLKKKNYRLVGVNRLSTNAFFVHNGWPHRGLPEVEVKDCFTHPRAIQGIQERPEKTKHLPWQDV